MPMRMLEITILLQESVKSAKYNTFSNAVRCSGNASWNIKFQIKHTISIWQEQTWLKIDTTHEQDTF